VSLPVIRPLSSALAGRLLHALRAVTGTERQFEAPRLFVSVGSWLLAGPGQIVCASVLSDVRKDGYGWGRGNCLAGRATDVAGRPLGKAGSPVDELMRAPAGQRAYAERGDPPRS
jgi:hypothetical protein